MYKVVCLEFQMLGTSWSASHGLRISSCLEGASTPPAEPARIHCTDLWKASEQKHVVGTTVRAKSTVTNKSCGCRAKFDGAKTWAALVNSNAWKAGTMP